jgi:argininosuccinate lyase
LWQDQAAPLDSAVLEFTVGEDPVLDLELLPFDCVASAAHAQMLCEIGVLGADELVALRQALVHIERRARAREIAITPEQEDCHTALEALLIEAAGESGRRIHTGRSRNDQVIMALRLLVRERLVGLGQRALAVVGILAELGRAHHRVVMPGFTHTRLAMPSTAGQLFACAGQGLCRSLETWLPALALANRSALGSASGFGVPLGLDRERVAELLALDGVDENTLWVQNSRGQLEAAVLFGLHQTALSVGRLATDLIWYSAEAYGFFGLPEALTTGSSIMPQKRNPDLLELMRAVPAAMLGRYVSVCGTLHGLVSGYHRDLQRTKSPLLGGLREIEAVLNLLAHTLSQISVDAERCSAAVTPELCATDLVYAKVKAGVPFREAYHQVKKAPLVALSSAAILAGRTHLGAPGTDPYPGLMAEVARLDAAWAPYAKAVERCQDLLASA